MKEEDIDRLKEKYKNHITRTNLIWIIGILVGIIAFLLTYKIWGKQGSFESLISIGCGIVSIFLSIFAITYSITESIKTSNREIVVNSILEKIKECVNKLDLRMGNLENTTTSTKNILEKMRYKYMMFYDNPKEYDDAKKESYNLSETVNVEKQGRTLGRFTAHDAVTNKDKIGVQNDNVQKPATTSEDINDGKYEVVASNEEFPIEVSRADIYYADMEKVNGVIKGTRPVIIVQNNLANKYSDSVTIVPITSKIFDQSLPTHIQINLSGKLSTVLVEIILTVPQRCLKNKIGELNESEIRLLNEALKFQLGILNN